MNSGFGIAMRAGFGGPLITPAQEYLQETGIRLAHDFAGDSLTDVIGGVVLTPSNGPASDTNVADTLPGLLVDPLPQDAPSLLWSHAFQFSAINQAFDAPLPGSVAFDDGPVMVHITYRVPNPETGLTELCGNYDGTSGIRLRINQAGDLVVGYRPQGQAEVSTLLAEAANNDLWRELVTIADRPAGGAGTLRIGSVSQEATIALTAGSLLSTVAFSIGMFLGAASTCQIMGVRIAFGDQVRAKNTQTIAAAAAGLIWLEQIGARVSTPAK